MGVVMCLGCGHFVSGIRKGGEWEPVVDVCPECGDESFRRVGDD